MNFNFSLPGLKKVTDKEWAGPCPICGGKDRFRVWLDEKKAGGYRWWCRGCGKRGDGIDLYRLQTNATYLEACQALRIEPRKQNTLQGKGFFSGQQSALESSFKTIQPTFPNVKWRQEAEEFLKSCQVNFNIGWEGEACPEWEAVEAIVFQRRINLGSCLQCGIGYNGKEKYIQRGIWGLEPGDKKLRIPRGIVIATRRRGYGIVGLTIRRLDIDIQNNGGPKYWQIAGSARDLPFVCGQANLPVVIVESALDAVLIDQCGDGNFASVALMGATKNIDDKTKEFIEQAPHQIIAYDKDPAGRKVVERLKKLFPLAVAIPPVGYKDLGEMHCNYGNGGMSSQEWLPAALKIAREASKDNLSITPQR